LRRQGVRLAGISQVFTASLASSFDAQHLAVEQGSPLLVLSRVASDPDGMPTTHNEHRYAADRVRLEVEFEVMSAAAMPDQPGLHLIGSAVPDSHLA
jgi:GntR family transcriptional regulator